MMRKYAMVVSICLAVAAGGCGEQPGERPDRLSAKPPAGSEPMARAASVDRFATGVPAGAPDTPEPPPAPDTVAALAADSIDDVVALHNVLAARAAGVDVPGDALAGQASDVHARFAALRTRIGVAGRGPAVRLASVVEAYERFAERAAEGRGGGAASLKTLDARWRSTLTTIGRASGLDLESQVPRLLVPRRTPVRAPERKAR